MWDGIGWAIAARPVGGTRGASVTGDTSIDQLSQLEFVLFANVSNLEEFDIILQNLQAFRETLR